LQCGCFTSIAFSTTGFARSLYRALLAVPPDGLPISIMIDGVTKPSRYANCAKTSKGLPPQEQRINRHFGDVHLEVVRRAQAGQLGLDDLMPQSASNVEPSLAEHNSCATQLHCARAAAKDAGALDEHGLIGATCAHVVPVLGSFCNMYTHEQVMSAFTFH
jgi:hypothetical protein